MKRKLKAKNRINKDQEATRGGISTNPGIFALNYTNTGKHLMGRTIPRYNGITSSYHTSAKYRRVYCCPNKEDYKMVKPCNPNTTGIKKVPFKQLSSRNYMRKRAYECGDGSCRSIDDDSLWKLSPEAHASSLTERLAAMALDSENGCIFNYKVTVVNDGGNNKFVLDGNSGMNVQFKVGNTYIFDVSDSTNGAHPMRFATSTAVSTNYDLIQVLGTQGEKNSKVIFKPKEKGTTWMYCTAHGVGMGSYYNGGNPGDGITVLDSNENLIKNRKCYDVERSQNSLLRGRVGCGVMSMTKEVKNLRVAMDASDRIRQMKSRTLNATCITSIKPFNNKKCTPPA